ncbi:Hint domain-containing protein [Nioella sp. MMSF_3534]|uniref:Hint domain-containing protein n=1 Tax=Nioella sp. MMSF_3534 TaxID=3046720 RepID=UPI00273D90DD|nr:Hint domain-containing protein [Nioella sp. MMSF_3534]
MPTSFTFGSFAYCNARGRTDGGDEGTFQVVATIDDGVVSVGDEVSLSGLPSHILLEFFDAAGVSGPLYYLGTGVFDGSTGYVFGTAATVGDSDGLFTTYDSSTAGSPDAGSDVEFFKDNPGSQTLGTSPACFLAGAMIATPAGEVAVETLEMGDQILTTEGHAVLVKWIGRQTVSTRFGPAERLMPVRFAAGSLGDGLPHSDLTVTADHGMLVDGVICHAGALVNGTTITRVPLAEMGETYTVYHIETEEHEIILANGAPAETFIDNVSRRAFDNYSEFEALYSDVPEMEELPYPRAMSARQVPARIRRISSAQRVA